MVASDPPNPILKSHPGLRSFPYHGNEQHRPIGTREGDNLLGVAAPRLVALDPVGLPAHVPEVLDAEALKRTATSRPIRLVEREGAPSNTPPSAERTPEVRGAVQPKPYLLAYSNFGKALIASLVAPGSTNFPSCCFN